MFLMSSFPSSSLLKHCLVYIMNESTFFRHSDLVGRVEVDPAIVERQYNYSKTMQKQIVTHARNALIAAIFLGMILGGLIAWQRWNGAALPIVLGVLTGGGSVLIIGGLAYFILTSVAKRGVNKWAGLRERVAQLKEMDKRIDKKAQDLYPVPHILLGRIIDQKTSVTRGSVALIKECNKYNESST